MTVTYTPRQLRNVAAISQEAFRHWKKVLPPLCRGSGRGGRFSAGDLLAVVIIRGLTSDFSIRVGAISPIATPLFGICNATPWPNLERSKLTISLVDDDLQFLQETAHVICGKPIIVVPLRPMVEYLRSALLAEEGADRQRGLLLAPTPLPSRAGST